jgi:ubiquinone/menaquinone biosynthesis C-methylase UbiE
LHYQSPLRHISSLSRIPAGYALTIQFIYLFLLRTIMDSTSLISSEIDAFYSTASEENRLKLGLGPLEYERNQELIQRYLSKQSGVIADIGGGPGIYAEWLSLLGHRVYLIDPVLKHIQQAKKRSGRLKTPFQCILAEAQAVGLPDESVDMVILHGPLYHLQITQHRLNAINEAKRILKKDGIILGFAINFAASAITGLLNGFIHHTDFFEMCKQELKSGVHHPAHNWPGLLPTAYFHKAEELQQEFESTGLISVDVIAVESFIWLDKNYFESRADPRKKEKLLELLRITEKEKSMLGISPHLMIAARKKC